ncbi:MAG: helix-turn-helix transcriptional regulator [Chloroflexi bacterium]|nr:helix-turn-helix transcriptional regulator [Chloroflexota bacterium]
MKERRWTLFTNHAAVLIRLLEHPETTIRTTADELELAERTVVGVLQDLRREGYLLVRKKGRHNIYRVNPDGPMKRPEHKGYTMREFLFRVQSELEQIASVAEKNASGKRRVGL